MHSEHGEVAGDKAHPSGRSLCVYVTAHFPVCAEIQVWPSKFVFFQSLGYCLSGGLCLFLSRTLGRLIDTTPLDSQQFW